MAEPDDDSVSLRDYVEARFVEVERSVAREVAVLRTLMAEHASAHAREHAMAQVAIDKAHDEMLRKFLEERAFVMHHQALVQRAVDKAEATINERLAGMNEFRSALEGQSAQMARREYVDDKTNAIGARLDTAESTLSLRIDERVNGVNTAGAERARVTNVRLDALEGAITRRLDELRETTESQSQKWANLEGRMYMIAAFMGFIIFIVTIVGFIMRELGG